jgi:hypothetical protein
LAFKDAPVPVGRISTVPLTASCRNPKAKGSKQCEVLRVLDFNSAQIEGISKLHPMPFSADLSADLILALLLRRAILANKSNQCHQRSEAAL